MKLNSKLEKVGERVNQRDWKNAVYQDLARYAASESIDYSVLNGYDPETGSVGRDLDVYIPCTADATKLLIRFKNSRSYLK